MLPFRRRRTSKSGCSHALALAALRGAHERRDRVRGRDVEPGEPGASVEVRERRVVAAERDERLQVGVRPVFGIDARVVLEAILVLRIVEAALDLARTPERAIRVVVHLHDGHEIDDRHAQVLQIAEARLDRAERSLRRERARLDLVDDAPPEPVGRLPRLQEKGARRRAVRVGLHARAFDDGHSNA